MKKYSVTVVVIIVLIVLVSYAHRGTKSTTTLTIGSLAHLTGFGNSWGIGEYKGAKMRVQELKTSGVNIDLVSEDCASEITKCLSAYSKLIDVDKVNAVVGPTWTEWYEPIAPVALQRKIITVAPSVAGTDKNYQPYMFGFAFGAKEQGEKQVQFASEKGAKRAAVVTLRSTVFDQLSIAEHSAVLKYGMTIVSDEVVSNPDERDFKTVVAKIAQSKPDVVFVNLLETQIIPFMKAARNQNVRAIYTMLSGVEHSVDNLSVIKGMYEVNPVSSQVFHDKYIATYHEEPSPSSQTAYDAVSLIADAWNHGARTSEEISTYIRNLKNYTGATGPISFDAQGLTTLSIDRYEMDEVK